MSFRRSWEQSAPSPPALPGLGALQRWLGGVHAAPGRLLVSDLTAGAALASAAASDASGGTSRTSGGTPSSAPSLQIVPVDAALADVPVPTIYLGGLPAPIPAGRPTIDADDLLHQLSKGQLPSDSLPEGDREAWRAASRITDPISAYNICQAGQLDGRRVVLTERGVAEQLARGTTQMEPVQAGQARRGGGGGGLPNPFAGLQRLLNGLSEERQLTRDVQARAEALGGQRPAAQPASGNSSSSSSDVPAASLSGQQEGQGRASDGSDSAAVAAGSEAGSEAAAPQQYSLHDLPARRLLAGGSPPQLAWVPLRVALSLLSALPQHFVLLQAAPQPPRQPKRHQRTPRGQQQPEQSEAPTDGSEAGGDVERGLFNARTAPGELDVWVVPGLHVRQITPEGNGVEFIPAFISHRSAQALWREVREVSGGGMLMYRRLERAMIRRRLEAAAALIAGGGLRGPSGTGGSAQDEDEGGIEEPHEVSEFVQELGGALGQEAGPLGGAAGGSGGVQPPSGVLPRMAATFACGLVSLAAQGLNWAGNTADWMLMATPLGPRLLGVPEATIQQHRLSELVGGMAAHNQQQAAMQCMLSGLSTLHDLAKEQQQAQQAEQEAKRAGARQHAQLAKQEPEGAGAQQQQQQQLAAGPQQAAPPAAEQQQGPGAAQPAAASAASAVSASKAPSAADDTGDGDVGGLDVQRAHAAMAASEAAAVLQYRRRLAAAALWVALSAKQVAEDPGVGGMRLGRLLAKTFLHQSSALTSAVDAAGLGGLPVAQHQAALPSGAPSPLSPPLQPPSSLAEAVEQMVAAGLPVLEHNGFQELFASEAAAAAAASSGRAGGARSASGAATSTASNAAAAAGLLAAAIARHATAETHLGLGAMVKDGGTGEYRVLPSNPLAPPAVGRGLLLVGELDLAHRQRGRTPGRTAARWLTVGVDDGRKLL